VYVKDHNVVHQARGSGVEVAGSANKSSRTEGVGGGAGFGGVGLRLYVRETSEHEGNKTRDYGLDSCAGFHHQMHALGCALAEARGLNRTLVLPRMYCLPGGSHEAPSCKQLGFKTAHAGHAMEGKLQLKLTTARFSFAVGTHNFGRKIMFPIEQLLNMTLLASEFNFVLVDDLDEFLADARDAKASFQVWGVFVANIGTLKHASWSLWSSGQCPQS
jgi:hypothetical protein